MSLSQTRVAFRLALAFGVVCLVMSLSAAVGIWRLAELQEIAGEYRIHGDTRPAQIDLNAVCGIHEFYLRKSC